MTRGDGSGLAARVLVAAVAALVIVPVSALSAGYGGPPAVVGRRLSWARHAAWQWLCPSGTLYAAGGGSRRMWVVLPFFCAGGVLGSLICRRRWSCRGLPAGRGSAIAWRPGAGGGFLALSPRAGGAAAAPRTVAEHRAGAGGSMAIGALGALAFLLSGQPLGVHVGADAVGGKGRGWAPPRSRLEHLLVMGRAAAVIWQGSLLTQGTRR